MTHDTKETISMMALTRVGYFNLAGVRELYDRAGSATTLMDHRLDVREVVPDASDKLVERLRDCDDHIRRAEEELEWTQRHGVSVLCLGDDCYPYRLAQC